MKYGELPATRFVLRILYGFMDDGVDSIGGVMCDEVRGSQDGVQRLLGRGLGGDQALLLMWITLGVPCCRATLIGASSSTQKPNLSYLYLKYICF